MKTIVERYQLPQIRKRFKDKKIVLCSGSFDLVHAGHAVFFEDCKKFGDILVVLVGSDIDIKTRKGQPRPILNQNIRIKTIAALKPVDFCFIAEKSTGGVHLHRPLVTALAALKPDFYVTSHDASDIPLRKKLCARHGTALRFLNRYVRPELASLSTTNLINKIRTTT